MEPVWVSVARKYLGQREIKGSPHNPIILRWWQTIRTPFTDDETPWCAGFLGGVLEECGIRSSRSAAARSYLKWGIALRGPVPGAIAVYERGPLFGHVNFVVGISSPGVIMGLGGNQNDAVTIAPFSINRVIGYRWPAGIPHPLRVGFDTLPKMASNAPLSRNEA